MRALILFITLLSIINFSVEAKIWEIPKAANVVATIGDADYGELDPNSIKILTWNIYKGKENTFERDYYNLSQDMDIVLIQESYLDYKMTRVFRDLPEWQFDMAISFLLKNRGNLPSGVANASRVKPTDIFWQRSRYREPVIRTPKMVIFGKYKIAGHDKELLTANIHAINFVSSRKLKHQIEQAAKVIASHDGPVVFGGDFNTWSKKKIRVMKKALHSVGMEEVPFNNGRMKVFGNIIDYVWIKGLKLKNSRVYGDVKGSDHKPMEIEVALP